MESDSRGASARSQTNEASKPGFDANLARLESIVSELEGGGLELEPAIERYQEGIELLKRCHRTLEGHRQRVEELSREAEGVLRPFAGDPEGERGAE